MLEHKDDFMFDDPAMMRIFVQQTQYMLDHPEMNIPDPDYEELKWQSKKMLFAFLVLGGVLIAIFC